MYIADVVWAIANPSIGNSRSFHQISGGSLASNSQVLREIAHAQEAGADAKNPARYQLLGQSMSHERDVNWAVAAKPLLVDDWFGDYPSYIGDTIQEQGISFSTNQYNGMIVGFWTLLNCILYTVDCSSWSDDYQSLFGASGNQSVLRCFCWTVLVRENWYNHLNRSIERCRRAFATAWWFLSYKISHPSL